MSLDHLPTNIEQGVQQIADELHIPRDQALLKVIEMGISTIRLSAAAVLATPQTRQARQQLVTELRGQNDKGPQAPLRTDNPEKVIGLFADAPEIMGIKDLSLNPSQIIAGNSTTATLVLTAFAGFEIPKVKVTTTGPISCPTSLTIPDGSDYVSFGVGTTGVTKISAASITATIGTYSKTVSFDVYPPFESASLTSTTVVGGTDISGSITGYLPAPAAGTPIWIEPSSYTYTDGSFFYIPSGQTKANFSFATYACPANTVVSLKLYSGLTSQTFSVTITPPPITGLTLNSSTIVGGLGVGATVTVSSNVANPGYVISITSNNAAATVPATVTIPGGLNSWSFTIMTKAVTKSTPVTITVKAGSSSASSVLTITP